jgi:hypothetical protein
VGGGRWEFPYLGLGSFFNVFSLRNGVVPTGLKEFVVCLMRFECTFGKPPYPWYLLVQVGDLTCNLLSENTGDSLKRNSVFL